MSLRTKTLLYVAAGMTEAIIATYLLLLWQVKIEYRRAEQRQVEHEGNKVLLLLKERLAELDATCRDWAQWDDTYSYMVRRNSAYERSNLLVASFATLHIPLVLFFDPAGHLYYGAWYDLAAGVRRSLPEDFLRSLKPGHPFVPAGATREVRQGFWATPWGLMLAVSRPVLPSDGQGPPRGRLLFARPLAGRELGLIAKATGLHLEATTPLPANVPPALQPLYAAPSTSTPIISVVERGDTIAAYTLVRDPIGQPVALLQITDTREFYRRSVYHTTFAWSATMFCAFLFCLLVLMVLEQTLLRRLAHLSQQVAALTATDGAARLVALPGRDELAQLAARINQTWQVLFQTQKQLRESEARYRSLVETSPDIIFQVDANLRFCYVNPSVQKVLGYRPDEMLGRSLADLFCAPEAAADCEMILALLARRQPFYGVQHTCLATDGRTVILETSAAPLFDEAGAFQGYVGLCRDITERKRMEEALAGEKERYRVTLHHMHDAVIATDLTGRLTVFNKAAERLTGWSAAEALGRPASEILQLIAEDNRAPLPDPFAAVPSQQQNIPLPKGALLRTREGRERLVAGTAAPILNAESRPIGVVLVCRDITLERRLEEAAQQATRLEALGLLAGGIAHDFNNLLTRISNALQLLYLIPEEKKREEFLTQAEKACFRAAELSQRLLTFAKGGAPVKHLEHLDTFVRETVEFALAGSPVALDLQVDPQLWPAEIDAAQISEAVQNIVINAVQAMPSGGTLHVHLENRPPVADPNIGLSVPHIAIVIQDEGSGIPSDALPRIFDPYFTTKADGSGLGLAVAYSIVTQHDGCILVDSQWGQGATFTICLPAAPSASKLPAPTQPEAITLAGMGRLLLMDDERPIAEGAALWLRQLGYDVTCVSSGEEALAAYEKAQAEGRPFDLVILDLTIRGGMGGLETLQQLRARDPNIRAIVCSGYSADRVIQDHRAYGFSASVRKPYDLRVLAQTVQAALTEVKVS